jgi:hypothetical protein
VIASYGHTYEQSAIQRHLNASTIPFSPITRERLTNHLIANRAIAATVDQWRQEHPIIDPTVEESRICEDDAEGQGHGVDPHGGFWDLTSDYNDIDFSDNGPYPFMESQAPVSRVTQQQHSPHSLSVGASQAATRPIVESPEESISTLSTTRSLNAAELRALRCAHYSVRPSSAAEPTDLSNDVNSTSHAYRK